MSREGTRECYGRGLPSPDSILAVMRLSTVPRAGTTAVLVVLLSCVLASAAPAQWVPDGQKLFVDQMTPLSAPDGVGGAYILTRDQSTLNATGIGVRAYHLNHLGYFAPGWPASGIPIYPTPSDNDDEWLQGACLQADGSLCVAFQEDNASFRRIYVTRLRPDGTGVPGWSPGFAAAPGVSIQNLGKICPTPDDGNFVLWQAGGLSNWDVWMMRLGADGQPAPGWPVAGHEVGAGPAMQLATSPVVSDGGDGAWLAYYSTTNGAADADVRVLHTDAFGDPAPGFPLYGLSPTQAPGAQALPWLCSDGGDGAFVAWSDARSCPGTPDPDLQDCYDIYLQHLTGAGAVAGGWPTDGLAVCVTPGAQSSPELLPDGAGGVYVGWGGSGAEGWTAHVQHVLADGTVAPGWPAGGRRMFGIDTYTGTPHLAPDGSGGLFVVAQLLDVGSQYRVYVQHVTASCQFDAVWGSMGLPMVDSSIIYDQTNPQPCRSLPGSVIVTWDDARTLYDEAFVARVSLDGVVATTVSLVAQDAAPDHVSLAWQAGGDALASATVERRAAGEAFRAIANVSPDGTGILRYEDHDVTPGARYAYRLVWSEAGGTQTTPEVWIEVPNPARFALAGAAPNPSPRASLSVAYSLAEATSARLELFDAQGRVVARRELATQAPGTHRERFPEAAGLRAGLYWLRLTQGANAATSRVVLVD